MEAATTEWLTAAVGSRLVSASGDVPTTQCKGKHVALYFSAHWCPPCRAFTPTLARLYEDLKGKKDAPFEIIYVSLDKSMEQFKEYFATMPWLAVPPDSTGTLRALQQQHSVMSVPTLLMFSPTGELLTRHGVAAVQGDPQGNSFPWAGHKQNAAAQGLTTVMQMLPKLLIAAMLYVAWKYFLKKYRQIKEV